MPEIDIFSVSTIPMKMYFDDTLLASGTSFIWSRNKKYWIISNWHNFSGKNTETGNHLSKTGGEPNNISISLNLKNMLGNRVDEKFQIRDSNNLPLWIVHPKFGNKIDISALQIEPNESWDLYPINEIPSRNLSISVGNDVYILGYPLDIEPGGFPIWKRGSIASEPEVFSEERRYILVDSASRPGMSGSPVIRRSWNTHSLDDGSTVVSSGAATKLIGVYSGRIESHSPLDLQLGMVWPINYIHEILDENIRDS